jgi:hypothetical protein
MMLAVSLAGLADRWADYYKDHTAAQVTIQFLHIGGLLAAGGLALATDRETLLVQWQDLEARTVAVLAHQRIHAWVLTALTAVVASGAAFFLADRDTYLSSLPFWLKMGSVATLLANGTWMLRLERACTRQPSDDRAWRHLRFSAGASVGLWFLTTLLGTVLNNAA